MKKLHFFICVVVGLLGIISAVLGFVAESKKTTLPQVRQTEDWKCEYPTSPAYGFGIMAASSLILAHTVVKVEAVCLRCAPTGPPSTKSNRAIAILSLVVSWITYVLAIAIFFAAALVNHLHTSDMMDEELGDVCFVVKDGVFAMGAVLGLVTVILLIIYSITASSVKSATAWGTQNQSIAMGQHSQVQANIQPVFVPENGYEPYGFANTNFKDYHGANV